MKFVYDLHIFKEQEFKRKNYFIPVKESEAQMG